MKSTHSLSIRVCLHLSQDFKSYFIELWDVLTQHAEKLTLTPTEKGVNIF
jgi:hypothetical protein